MAYENANEETIEFLKSRPWWSNYYDRLQAYLEPMFPGTHVVAVPNIDQTEQLFYLKPVSVTSEDVISLKGQRGMKEGDCHFNVLKLKKAGLVEKWIMGFALSEDGLWRFHSWGMKGELIVETTEEQIAYIGVSQ